MALEVDFDLCQTDSCSYATINDLTGAYHSSNNTTGFGSPNISYGDSGFTASIIIEDSEGNITETDITGQITDDTGDTIFAPISVEIPDGSYTVTYVVSTNSSSSSKTKKYFSYCTVQCCVFGKMKDAISKANCNCEKDLNYELYLWSIFKSMQFAARGCDYDEAENLLAQLELVCDTDDCGCN